MLIYRFMLLIIQYRGFLSIRNSIKQILWTENQSCARIAKLSGKINLRAKFPTEFSVSLWVYFFLYYTLHNTGSCLIWRWNHLFLIKRTWGWVIKAVISAGYMGIWIPSFPTGNYGGSRQTLFNLVISQSPGIQGYCDVNVRY